MAKLTYFVCYNLSLSGMIKNVNSSSRELSISKKWTHWEVHLVIMYPSYHNHYHFAMVKTKKTTGKEHPSMFYYFTKWNFNRSRRKVTLFATSIISIAHGYRNVNTKLNIFLKFSQIITNYHHLLRYYRRISHKNQISKHHSLKIHK